VRGTGAIHGDGEDVNLNTGPLLMAGVCEGGLIVMDELCGVREVVVYAVFLFPDYHFLIYE
jgi:hypothetical protein